jgi:hypothetical protein
MPSNMDAISGYEILTGAQGSAVVEAVDLGGRRLNTVASSQNGALGVLVEKPLHLIAITTVVTHIFRHDG